MHTCVYTYRGTAYLGLRVIEEADLPALARLRNDASTWVNLTHPALLMPADQQRWYASLSGKSGRLHLIAYNDEHPIIGTVRMDEYDPDNRNLRVGADVLPELRRQGWGTRIYETLLAYCFRERGLHRVWLAVLDRNEAGIKLYEKMGFKHEGRYREAVWRDGRWQDYLVMAILESEMRPLFA